MKELIALNKSRIKKNNLSEWLLLGCFYSKGNYRQAFLSPDTSEHFKVLLFDKRNVETEQCFWFDAEQEVNRFIQSWSNGATITNNKLKDNR